MICQRITLPSGVPMDVYAPTHSPAPHAPRKCLLICPGGGYSGHAGHEADPIALRFAGMGFACFVVYYRVAPHVFPAGLQDIGSAVACIRQHADEWHADPNAIAVLGFSAGGHAAGTLGVMWQDESLWQPLGLTCEQVKPNALVLCYAVLTAGEFAHRGSFENLTGSSDLALHQRFSLEKLVTVQTPPTFLWHTWTDQIVPVENALCFASALYKAGVQAEVHVYPYGPHGLALSDESTSPPERIRPEATDWPEKAALFLRSVM